MATVILENIEYDTNIDGGALTNWDEGDGPDLLVNTSTLLRAENLYNGYIIEVTGENLSVGEGLEGTVTGFAFYLPNGDLMSSVSDIRISGATMDLIFDEISGYTDDEGALVAALDDGNLSVNASNAIEGQLIWLGGDFQNATRVIGSRYNDEVIGGSGRDVIKGGNGADEIKGGSGRDKIIGGRGNDDMDGGGGRDVIRGNGGRDVLDGERGNDVLIGGGGLDTFVFVGRFGKDVIRDFNENRNGEKIDLSAVNGIRNYRDLSRNHMEQDGDDVVITVGKNQITILDVSIDDMNRGDFIF